MANRFRGSSQARVIAPRRKTSWEVGTGDGTVTARTDTTPTFVGLAVTSTLPGLTVARIRGFFQVKMLLATSEADGMSGAFGIGIASLAAVTASIASVPTPITESDAENWLYHQFFTSV